MLKALKKSIEDLIKQEAYLEAEKKLLVYLEENPSDQEAKLLYGICRMMLGDIQAAKKILEETKERLDVGSEISVEQKTFFEKYASVIFYGAVGAALVAAAVYGGKTMLNSSASVMVKYGGPPAREVSMERAKYAGPPAGEVRKDLEW